MNYDFVIRFETIIDDSDYLLRFLQRNDSEEKRITFIHTREIRSNETKTENVFKNVPKETIEKLKKIYWDDFKIMDHDFS